MKENPILGAVCMACGLLFASGNEENLLQGAIALAFFVGAAACFGAFKSHYVPDETGVNAKRKKATSEAA